MAPVNQLARATCHFNCCSHRFFRTILTQLKRFTRRQVGQDWREALLHCQTRRTTNQVKLTLQAARSMSTTWGLCVQCRKQSTPWKAWTMAEILAETSVGDTKAVRAKMTRLTVLNYSKCKMSPSLTQRLLLLTARKSQLPSAIGLTTAV